MDKDKEVVVWALLLSLSFWNGEFGGMFEDLVSK